MCTEPVMCACKLYVLRTVMYYWIIGDEAVDGGCVNVDVYRTCDAYLQIVCAPYCDVLL
jgi:hypothetical protein